MFLVLCSDISSIKSVFAALLSSNYSTVVNNALTVVVLREHQPRNLCVVTQFIKD